MPRLLLHRCVMALAGVAFAGCSYDSPQPTPTPTVVDVRPDADTDRIPGDGTATVLPPGEPLDAAPEAEPRTDVPGNEPATEGEPADETAPEETPAASETAEDEPAADGRVLLGSPELTAGIPGEGPLSIEELEAWLADPKNHETLDFVLPLGLNTGASQVKGLDVNPLTRAKIELGRQLYFDPRLSSDASVSCASCHHPDTGWARQTQFGEGIKGQRGGRNSPVSYNRILSDLQFWDGRAGSLEEQAVGPIQNPIEMGNTHEACVECLAGVEGYRLQFEKIFGGVTISAVGQAIASFERAIVTGPSPFDYQEHLRPYLAEDVDLEELQEDDPETYAAYEQTKVAAEAHPMSEGAARGRELFFGQKAGCTACHVGPNLSDEKYHNIGVGMSAPEPDLGRFVISMEDKDRGAFKTPTIRNVEQSAPYMHDGSQKTLEEVVDFYVKGGHPNPHLDEKIKKLELTDQDKQDLVAFMKACTGDFPQVQTGRLPE